MALQTLANRPKSLAALACAARGWARRHAAVPTIALAALVVAMLWGGGVGCKQEADEPVVVNQAPVANAGKNQALPADRTVSLDGRGSYDPDGDAIWFTWSMDIVPPGSEMGPDGARGANPFSQNNSDSAGVSSFAPDRIGTYVVKLVVTDGLLESGPSYVIIDAAEPDDRPLAVAGDDQVAAQGALVTLDGSASSDPLAGRNGPLQFQWTLTEVPYNSGLESSDLRGATTETASFTPDADGTYMLQLIVDNGMVASLPDTVIVDVLGTNGAPVARAGAAQTIPVGSSATLDGSGSFDTDGGVMSYFWELQSKPAASLANNASFSDRTLVNPVFTPDVAGPYLLSLSVFDGTIWSAPAFVTITVAATYRLAVYGSVDPGQGTVTADLGAIDCLLYGSSVGSGTCGADLLEGSVVTLTAAPSPGSRFTGWDVQPVPAIDCPDTETTCVVTLTADTNVTALFVPLPTVRLFVEGSMTSGTGTVTSDVGGIDCAIAGTAMSGTCQTQLPVGTVVTLTAAPVGANPVTWSGRPAPVGACAPGPTCAVTVDADSTVTVEFPSSSTVTLTIDGGVAGSLGFSGGHVVGDAGGIDCRPFGYRTEGVCTAEVTPGTVVTLTALPDAGYTFTSFGYTFTSLGGSTGQPDCSSSPCQVTVTAATTATVTFTAPPPTRTVNITSGGMDNTTTPATQLAAGVAGTIVAISPGASCDFSACAAPNALYLPGAVACSCTPLASATVVLKATPNSGYGFVDWSGCSSASGDLCTIDPSELPVFVSATFSKP